MKRPVWENVTPVTARVAWSFLQENWLDFSFKKLEIKGVSSVGRRYCLSGRSRFGAVADPIGKYFPLRITLRSPELASRMAGIAACLLCQRVQQQAALQDRKSTRLNSSHQIISYAV